MRKRCISISSCFDYGIPFNEQIPMIAKAGFSCISVGLNFKHSKILSKESREEIKSILKSNSICIDTIHGCQTDLPDSVKTLSSIAEAAVDLGTKIVVIHPTDFEINENEVHEKSEILYRVCNEFEYISSDTGIVFAIENLHPGYASDVVRNVLPKLNDKYFGFCYDSSHEQIDGLRPFDLLEKFRHRIVAVHLSDRIKEFVDHAIPGEGFIDWDGVCSILKEVHYDRPLLLELMIMNSKVKETEVFLEKAYDAGCRLYDTIHS